MDPIDLEIRMRLEKLKEPQEQVPSEHELQARLIALKDCPEATTSPIANKCVLFPKPQSSAEQVDNLLKQFTDEVTLHADYRTSTLVDDIEKRLQKLKSDEQPKLQSKPFAVRPRESDTKVLLKKILAEATLEKKSEEAFPPLIPQFSSNTQEKEEKEEEMDFYDCSDEEFCTICDRSPKWTCLDCDKHVFCVRCFKEYHEDINECHRKKQFVRRHRIRSIDSDEYSD